MLTLNKILYEYDMVTLPEEGTGVLYAGWYEDTSTWKIVKGFVEKSDKLYFISDTNAGKLMNDNYFLESIEEIVGENNFRIIFGSESKYCDAIEGMGDVLSFNDFISQNFAEKYVKGDILMLANDYNENSVMVRTELEQVLYGEGVDSINGIPREHLLQYFENLLNSMSESEAYVKLTEIISLRSYYYLSDLSIYSFDGFIRDSLIEKFGIEFVENSVTEIGSNNYVIVDTSGWIEASMPILCSEMCHIEPYADKPNAFGLLVHSFVSYERIGKWDADRYAKGGRKPYFIELCRTPRWINLYMVADEDVYCNYEG